MKTSKTVKELQSQLSTLEGEITALKVLVASKQKELGAKNTIVKSLRTKIFELNHPQETKVSEHAIVRYFERVKGFDIPAIEKEILSDKVKELIGALGGNGTYPNGSYQVVVKDNVVVTVK